MQFWARVGVELVSGSEPWLGSNPGDGLKSRAHGAGLGASSATTAAVAAADAPEPGQRALVHGL